MRYIIFLSLIGSVSTILSACGSDPTPYEYDTAGLVLFKRAEAHFNKGEYKEAIPLYKKVIDIRYMLMDAYKHLADSYEKIGKDEEAIAVYEKANLVDSKDLDNLQNLIRLYEKHGYTEKAFEARKKLKGLVLQTERNN